MVRKADDLDQGWEIQDHYYCYIYKRTRHLLRIRHNTFHTRVSYYYARKLLEAEGGDPRLVLLAYSFMILAILNYQKKSLRERLAQKLRNLNSGDFMRLKEFVLLETYCKK